MADPATDSNGTDRAAEHHQQRLRDGADCLAAALRYLALGWAVLPNCPPDHAGESDRHRQKCDSLGKSVNKPRGYLRDATNPGRQPQASPQLAGPDSA